MNAKDELQRLCAEGGSHARIKYLRNKAKRATIAELRKLLRERGVRLNEFTFMTQWAGAFGESVEAYPTDMHPDALLVKHAYLTPAQAIAATLGTGTCKAIISDNLTESEGTGDAWADCSECGHLLYVLTDPNSEPPNFCPNCGRKVVDE